MRAKTILLLTFVMLFGLQTSFGQDPEFVKQIRSDVGRINKSLKKYKKETKLVEGISLEGTEANFYSSRYGLRKVEAEMFGETFRANAAFYYKNGELIFAFYQFNRYDTHISADPPPKVVKTEEKRFYFVDGKLKRLLMDKESASSDSKEWKEALELISDLDGKLRKALANG